MPLLKALTWTLTDGTPVQVREQPLFSGVWAEKPRTRQGFLLDLLVSPSGKVCFFVVTQTSFGFFPLKPPSLPVHSWVPGTCISASIQQLFSDVAHLQETPRTRLEVGSEALLQIILWA